MGNLEPAALHFYRQGVLAFLFLNELPLSLSKETLLLDPRGHQAAKEPR